VSVHLHTTLQRQSPEGRISRVEMNLPEGATIEHAIQGLAISMDREALILVLNNRIAEVEAVLTHGDRLDIVPAISGGVC
jgi:sulfur carrier protein ThiS